MRYCYVKKCINPLPTSKVSSAVVVDKQGLKTIVADTVKSTEPNQIC